MSQSEIVVGALLAGFVLYLLATKRLQAYWQLLTGGGGTPATPQGANPPVTSTTPPPSGTSTGNVGAFVPGSVQNMGNVWTWTDPVSGGPRVDYKPPPGYVPPAPAAPAAPATGG